MIMYQETVGSKDKLATFHYVGYIERTGINAKGKELGGLVTKQSLDHRLAYCYTSNYEYHPEVFV